ncbi:MAG: Gx transporter family protein [Firmicutes bacterium]|nr:Gx transporter family protein [Bacillota bacterium]
MNLKKLIFIALMISSSIVLSILESMFSTALFIIPGVKLGLANVITLIILYIYGYKEAFVVVILRIFLVALVYSGIFNPTALLSLSGGIFAYITMVFFKKIRIFSIISVSVAGAFMHMVGQIIMAMIILDTPTLLYYLPYMILISIPTGIFVGLASKKLVFVFENQLQEEKK